MKLIWGIFLTALLFALPARADALYDISGTATLTGDNSCNGLCIETINFDFQLDEQPVPCGDLIGCQGWTGYDALLANNLTITTSGPLGAPPSGGNASFVDDKFMGIDFDGNPVTEFDLVMNPFPPPGFPFTPTGIGGYLYSCAIAGCYGFCPLSNATVACSSQDATMRVSITPVGPPGSPMQTPEPAPWALLALGLSAFIPMKLRRLLDGARGPTG